MRIGGIQKLSLIDYPGHLSTVVFTQGCNLRCPYCHNPELVLPQCFGVRVSEDEIFSFLATRVGKLQAVVVTGGEPTLHADLPEFLAAIKRMGFKTKLDTNGTRPEALQLLIAQNLTDFVAMDIKAPLAFYHELSGCRVDVAAIRQSIELILSAPVQHQFRTTVEPKRLSKQDCEDIQNWMNSLGARHIFQNASSEKTLESFMMLELDSDNKK